MLRELNRSKLNDQQMSTTSIEEVLAYKNKELISKFCETYVISTEETEEIFTETKKFLYLCAHIGSMNIAIYEPTLVIDEMWHMFILFTKDYHDFCIKYFGYYLHHSPETKKKRITDKNRADFKQQLVKVTQILGKDTLIKWYNDYAINYSPEHLNNLRKPLGSKKLKNKKLPIITTDMSDKHINDIINTLTVHCSQKCRSNCIRKCIVH